MKVFLKKPVSLLLLLVTTIAYSGYAQSSKLSEQVLSVTVKEALNQKQAKTAQQEIKQLTLAWMKGWSPQSKPFTAEELRPLYARGDGEILVVDDFEGRAVVIRSFEEYQRKWVPVMRRFSYWAIQPKGEIQVLLSGDLAVSTFTWVAQARLKGGNVLQPAPSQHGTLVWQKREERWQIEHEHLTRARPEN